MGVSELIDAGEKRVAAVNERGVSVFDRRTRGCVVRMDAAVRACDGAEKDFGHIDDGRFWGSERSVDSCDSEDGLYR